MRYLTTCAAIALCYSLTACSQDEEKSEAAAPMAKEEAKAAATLCHSEGVTVTDAWVREARAGQPTTAAYLTICNGAEADTLLSISYAGAAAAEIHLTSMGEDGSMVMSPASAGIPLPSGELVKLEPGGAHIMLIGMTFALAPEERVPMTLTFAHADPMEVTFHVHGAMDGGAH